MNSAPVTARGFAAIALFRPKSDGNIGGAIRAAGVFGAKLVVIGAARTVAQRGRVERTEPRSTHRHIPVQWLPDVFDGIPHDCATVAVEIAAHAVSLPNFQHPERAYYVFGAEDGGLPNALRDVCDHVVQIPAGSLNLSAAVNVVLYSRVAQRGDGANAQPAHREKRGANG